MQPDSLLFIGLQFSTEISLAVSITKLSLVHLILRRKVNLNYRDRKGLLQGEEVKVLHSLLNGEGNQITLQSIECSMMTMTTMTTILERD